MSNAGQRVQNASSYATPVREPGTEAHNITTPSSQVIASNEPLESSEFGNRQVLVEESGKTGDEQSKNSVSSHKRRHRSRRPTTPPLTLTRVRAIMQSQGHNIRSAPSVLRRLNAQIEATDRFLNSKATYLATVVKSNSLYTRDLGLVQWKSAFKEIYTAKRYQRAVRNPAVIPTLKEDDQALLEKIQADCHGSFRDVWQTMSRRDKASTWQRLALWLLLNDPQLFLEFLLVTTEGKEKPDFTMVADCLRYLDNFHYADWLKDWKSGAHNFESLVEACLHPRDWPIISLPQKGARLYIRRASHEAVTLAFNTARGRSVEMTAETALCFMWRFTEFRDVDHALKSLEYIPMLNSPELSLNSKEVLRHCCKLLTLDSVQDGDNGRNGRNFRILPRLLKMGVRPDRDMMNLVLDNAYKTGDSQLGADMLQFMKNHGHNFDAYTYMTLLKDAVKRGDRGGAEVLIQKIEEEEELRSNPYLASKVFHTHYVFTAKHMDEDTDPSGVFYSMLDMYNTLHDITPLKELLIIPPQYMPRPGGSNTPPSRIALYTMIATFFRCHTRPETVQRIYHRFRELVTQGHPFIAPLAETDHTYNEFLVAMRVHPRGLRSCVRLVEDMLHPPTLSSTGEAMIHTKPTVITWTILLSAFVFHRELEAAEKIKEMMSKHQVQYDESTWNTVISGHVNAQNIPETAAAIKTMEEEGFSINPYTMKSLRYLRDPERLWAAINELDKRASEESQEQMTSTPESGTREEENEENEKEEKEGKEGKKDQLLDSALRKLALK
ncbi:hypothetical protein PENDEC_c002G00636 [Penicillium decumbens]|uniref:Pentacotripeptide-repeat region of PRORP domain-containing protein n=1 Tax=Penicillium decumbens TaxID=69771 RepID=A0A1V6PLR5_PENDC|nr:hypothetical protein PENDEC_c002G00636 [Penicillium decumbens]